MTPTALFLFNSSDYAVQPWIDRGYTCVSVDYDDTDHAGSHRAVHDGANHYRIAVDLSKPSAMNDVLLELAYLPEYVEYPSFVLSFAPCTDLAVSGAGHFKRKAEADPEFQVRAVRMAKLAAEFGVPYIVENPVSVLATLWRKPTGYVHPWQFANLVEADGTHPEFPDIIPPYDLYNKKTGLWCGKGAKMPEPTWDRKPPIHESPGFSKLGGKSARTKYIRSLTPRGLAEAIARANA
jgi:hypothetical protein